MYLFDMTSHRDLANSILINIKRIGRKMKKL